MTKIASSASLPFQSLFLPNAERGALAATFENALAGFTSSELISDALVPNEIQLQQKTPLPTHKILSENEIPLNTVVLAHDSLDIEEGKAIAQAVLKANPNAKILFEVKQNDFAGDVKSQLAQKYGIPAANVEYITDSPNDDLEQGGTPVSPWPRDTGLVGGTNDIYTHSTPLRHASAVSMDLNKAAGLTVKKDPNIGMGGDIRFVTRPDGNQIVLFGSESIENITSDSKFYEKASPRARALLAVAQIMKDMGQYGIAPDRVMPIGYSSVGATYGSMLAQLTPEERKSIDPSVLKHLESIKDLAWPEISGDYHSDLTIFTPDGVNAFISRNSSSKPLSRVLTAYGFKVYDLPLEQRKVPATQGSGIGVSNEDNEISVNYMNMDVAVDPNGKKVILMPTEAADPNRLSLTDRQALKTIQAAVGNDVRVIPAGGRTALLGYGLTGKLNRDWGIHCRTLVLPQAVVGSRHPEPRPTS